MTKILKDYLGGTLVVSPGDNLNTKLANYLAVVDYDLALQNNKLPIIVSRSGDSATNGTYTIVDSKKRGLERVWSLGNNRIQYDTSSYRWVLTKSSVVVFSSSVCVKPYDPWLLLWESATPGVAVPVIDSEGIDLRYIDVFPSYRTYDLPATSSSGYVAKYNLLKSIMNLVFPTDKIQDGVAVS